MIVDRILESKKPQLYPVHSNRASELGHECLRYLVYNRTRWQEKALPSPNLMLKLAKRAIAKRLKAKRVGILSKSDVEHPLFSCEVKSRLKFVGEKWFLQAVRNCEQGKIPAVIVHVTGHHHKNNYVILRLKDFEDLLGRVKW